MARPGGEDLPFVFSGTLVVRGDGVALCARPAQAANRRIGQALGRIAAEPPRLQQQTRQLVRNFAVFGMAYQPARRPALRFLRGDFSRRSWEESPSACRCCPRNSRC
jgi:Ca2+-transporting ATPase